MTVKNNLKNFLAVVVTAALVGWSVIALGESLVKAETSGSTLSLTGKTLQPALPSATVEVSFGGQTVTSITDPHGGFEVDINCNDNDAMVFIYAQGSGAQSHIRASRVVDSCAALSAAASAGSFEVGLVSPISTAAYALLRWQVENVSTLNWPPNGTEMLQHRQTVTGLFANRILHVLPSMIAEHLPLPAGKANTLEVLLDRTAFLDYEAQLFSDIDTSLIDSARQAVLWNAQSNVRTETLSELSKLTYYCAALGSICPISFWTEAGQDYYTSSSNFGGLADFGGLAEVLFRALQDTVFVDNYGLPDDNLRALRLTRADGEPLTEVIGFPFHPDHGQIEARHQTIFYDLRLLDASESLPLGSVVSKRRTIYPNGELPNEVSLSAFPSIHSVIRSEWALPTWAGPSGGEDWHMPLFLGTTSEVGSISPFRWDRLSFIADGTGQTELTDLSFNWSMVDGALEIEGPEFELHRYRFLGGDLDRQPAFEALYKPTTEDVRSIVHSLVLDNDPPAFSTLKGPIRYYGGFFDLDEWWLLPFASSTDDVMVFHLDPDGTGWRAFMNDPTDTRPADAQDLTWETDNYERLTFRRDLSGGFLVYRSWSPMALHSPTGDLYVRELGPLFSQDPDYEFPNIPGRLSIYRRLELPD